MNLRSVGCTKPEANPSFAELPPPREPGEFGGTFSLLDIQDDLTGFGLAEIDMILDDAREGSPDTSLVQRMRCLRSVLGVQRVSVILLGDVF
jgi:hypothetical protein